jgi:O-antigen ligase
VFPRDPFGKNRESKLSGKSARKIAAEKVATMYPTPTLWFEIGATILGGIVFLWTKPEHALFLYAFALGFPDIAYPIGTTINLRVEDVLILLFLARTILWTPAPLSRHEKTILMWQAIFLAVCLLSTVVEIALGKPPEGYDAAKMVGCAVIILVLPRLVQSQRRLRFFVAGLMCGGVALAIQVHQHLGESASNNIANFQQMKSAATFETWNPNTIGQAAVLLVLGAGLGGIICSKTLANRILWPCLAMGFALVPAFVFVRGTSVSIAAGFVLFLFLMNRWKWVLVFAAICLCAVLYLQSRDPQLMEDATNVNVTTGEGLSHRFERWDMAFRGIQKQPFLGHGFGQEWIYLSLIGSEGRAHNAYLTIWLELGLGGLLVFLAAIFQFVRAGFFLYGTARFQFHGALVLALIFSMCLDSLALNTLYWEKLPMIALSLAVAVIGICERDDPEFAAREIRVLTYQPSAQHS